MKHYSATEARVNPAKAGVEDPSFEVLLAYCDLTDSARSLTVRLLVENGEWRQLVELDFDPFFYEWNDLSIYRFAVDYQVTSFFIKAQFDIGIDREEVAYLKWKATEELCAKVNETFRCRWSGVAQPFPDHVEAIFHGARQKIQTVLKSVDLAYVSDNCHFGPGADLSTRGDNTSSYFKYSDTGTVSPACVEAFDAIFSQEDGDVRRDELEQAQLVSASRLSFVPKNAKTHRAINVEPRWNVFLQLGIGALISKRLRRCGIDIRDQTRNQHLASRAHIDQLSTIDLSSASDSVATNLVVDLFGLLRDPMWLDLILKTRCPRTLYKGEVFRLEKVSSMGNGYTFPLETLIFYAFAWSAMQHVGVPKERQRLMSVYGDDIVIPREASAVLIESLKCFGFLVNAKKTFISGAFFESCGKDFYHGKDVRPLFVKRAVDCLSEAYTLHNQIYSSAIRFGSSPGSAYSRVWAIRDLVFQRIPQNLRFRGPPDAGDGCLHSTFDEARPWFIPAQRGFGGYYVRSWITKSLPLRGNDYVGHLRSKLDGITDTGNLVHTRKRTIWRKGQVYLLRYTDVTVT